MYTLRFSLNSPAFLDLNQSAQIQSKLQKTNSVDFSKHQQWNHQSGWKNVLNNLRLIVQPILLFWLIYPWIDTFSNSELLVGFNHLIDAMNGFKSFYSSG